MSLNTTKKCGNNGCGKEYTEETINQCCYHPGNPIFHEGLKGWSCCAKRVIDFDDFLQISGCASGSHKEKVATPTTTTTAAATENKQPTTVDNMGREVYGSGNATKSSDRFVPKQVTAPAKPAVPLQEYVVLFDDPSAVIQPNTACTRPGCKATYVDESSKEEVCNYHPGEPVFHEGSKGWSCCKPKAAIFEEFLKIKGCKESKHKFVPIEVKSDSNYVECRNDWYQSFDYVYLSIYAKQCNKEKSTIEFVDPTTVNVNLILPNDKIHKKTFKLAHSINTGKSSFSILSTKVEVKLVKEPQDSWSKLEESEADLYRYQV